MSTQNQTLFTEIFPVIQNAIPTLSAYKLDARGGDYSIIGGKLAYRLKRVFDGHWAWAGGLIVTDKPQDIDAIMTVVRTLWSEQPDIFKGLRAVTPLENWQPNAQVISEFVSRGLLSDGEKEIQQTLLEKKQDLGNALVERVHEVRGWIVNGEPAVSISISSRLVLKQDLKTYSTRVQPDQLVGLQVADKTSTLKGELTEIVGTLATERVRLMNLTQREEMQKLLGNAPDSELVVTISNGRNEYDYAVSSLRIILYLEYLHRFGINSRQALSALRIEPGLRAGLVKNVSTIAIKTGYLQRAYSTRQQPEMFRADPYAATVKFGNGSIAPYSEQTIVNDLRNRKLYRVLEKYKAGNPIRVGILTALETQAHTDFWGRIEGSLRSLGFTVQKLGEVTIRDASRAELDVVVSEFQAQEPDILVAFFPDDFADEDDDESGYYHFKSLTIGRGIPSQVIELSTLENDKSITSSINNIILGIIGKIGNIPYVLATPLSFADVVVGIDIARDKMKRLSGSMNATAIARIYLGDGEFLQYVIHDAPLEGETIPTSVLQALFPVNEFSGKRVVIHRDGYFRGDEKKTLNEWATKIGATFNLVEVIKTGAPRIYAFANEQTVQPQKGSTFLLSSTEAILVSSLPPFKNATPQPLRIRTEAPFDIEQAIESVLVMTNLHYGSVRSPRLPVTIHYSDKIAYLALRGIKPKNLEGKIPFWL